MYKSVAAFDAPYGLAGNNLLSQCIFLPSSPKLPYTSEVEQNISLQFGWLSTIA